MTTKAWRSMQSTVTVLASAALTMILAAGTFPGASAGEAEAKTILKSMSDYMAGQKAISFAYDTNFEVVTKDHQKLLLASSGKVEIDRPDKFRATRSGGFAHVETTFDGRP